MLQPTSKVEEVPVPDRMFRNLVVACMLIVVGVFMFGFIEAAAKVVPQNLLSSVPTLVTVLAIVGIAVYAPLTDRTIGRGHHHHHAI